MIGKRKIPYDLDDPRTTQLHRDIILNTPFLKKMYLYWYKEFEKVIQKNPQGHYLKLGPGGGFLKDLIPNLITSDILPLPYVDEQINAEPLPFENESLNGIFSLDVFHHIPRPYLFLKEAERCLKPNGKIVIIDPANTSFSRCIYKKLHHEPLDEKSGLTIEEGRPLSNSNQDLSYIYFIRGKNKFQKNFPHLKDTEYKLSYNTFVFIEWRSVLYPFVPSFTFSIFNFAEKILKSIQKHTTLFQTIIIQKQ